MISGRRYDRASPTRAEPRDDGIDPKAAEQWHDDRAGVGEAEKLNRRLNAVLHQLADAIAALNAIIAKSGRKPPTSARRSAGKSPNCPRSRRRSPTFLQSLRGWQRQLIRNTQTVRRSGHIG